MIFKHFLTSEVQCYGFDSCKPLYLGQPYFASIYFV